MSDDDSCSSDDSDLAFASIDFSGVDFTEEGEAEKVDLAHEAEKEPAVDPEGTSKESEGRLEMKNTMKNTSQENIFLQLQESPEKNASITSVHPISLEAYEMTFDKVCVKEYSMETEDSMVIREEEKVLLNDCFIPDSHTNDQPESGNDLARIQLLSKLLSQGQYAEVLTGESAGDFFNNTIQFDTQSISVAQEIRDLVLSYCTNVNKCVEVEMIGVASLNLFLQINYTGPSLYHGGVERPGKEDQKTAKLVESVNPHQRFSSKLNVSLNEEREKEDTKSEETNMQIEHDVDVPFQNSVLSELSVDGEWPCPVCKWPYFLLLARSILLTLADPNRPDWSRCLVSSNDIKIVLRKSSPTETVYFPPPSKLFVSEAQKLKCVQLWSARAAVAHSRLIQADEPSILLWEEVEFMFKYCKDKYCDTDADRGRGSHELAAKICLEFGLAEHYFDMEKKGKKHFQQALSLSGMNVEVTGSEGKRTKYQQKSTAQMLVRAVPTSQSTNSEDSREDFNENCIAEQQVKLEEDTILLDRVKYEDEEDNVHHELSILQQTILLALCLDVKNDNPMDGLTGEQMGAFLARVLQQHDDWMVYATGLLERAWLESEGNHTRQRALLQLQALVDQHSNRLTLTQSTFEAAVENSAPPQERLKNLHYIVYPPRWEQLRDLAERYAAIGIVTSAAEIFEEIELWDEVVECYRRAGKEGKAEAIVRKRLEERETPRMWAALGDITKDYVCYEKALDLSGGKFSTAFIALGKHYSDKGDLLKAIDCFRSAVRVKPLSPHVWFRLGALSMKTEDWETALHAFTEVVQQEPEEADAWANVAAVHMRNRNPTEAYPALVEVSDFLWLVLMHL